MREIVTLQFGSCGIDIGNGFWKNIMKDHWLDNDGWFVSGTDLKYGQSRQLDEIRLNKINTYFNATNAGFFINGYIRQKIESTYNHLNYIPYDVKNLCNHFYGQLSLFKPRAILIDSDPDKINDIQTSNISHLFHSKNLINGTESNGYNWAKGYWHQGRELLNEIINRTNKEVEACDSLQGFQLCHSIGGGTGSGLTSLIMETLNDDYPNKTNINFQVYPSPKVCNTVVEPYNAILTIDKFLTYSNFNFVIDNESLFHISRNVLKQKQPKYSDYNWVISMAITDSTAPLRFDNLNKLNITLKRYGINMCPFPRLHNMLIAQAPLFAPSQGKRVRLTTQELTDQMGSSRNFLCNVKSEDGKYMAISLMYRGYMNYQEVEDEACKIAQKMADDYVTWIPNNEKYEIVAPPPSYTPISGIMVANTTAIKGVYQRICYQFAKMFKRKAFLHWYTGEGMDEMDFIESDKNVRNLITEYQDKQDAIIDFEDDSEDDEEYEDEDDEEYEDEDDEEYEDEDDEEESDDEDYEDDEEEYEDEDEDEDDEEEDF